MADIDDTQEFSEPAPDGSTHDNDALDLAIAQAHAELDARMQDASTANAQTGDYTLRDVTGVGRYAVPRRHGWLPLLEIIHDADAKIGFSLPDHPGFDAILDRHFEAPQLSDPRDAKYESWAPLRETIAAVRNFLMQTYYTDTPAGMTPQKARESLAQIAAFVGDGLRNHRLVLGMAATLDPRKPFINATECSKTGGVGAQYLYEKILEWQRQSSWLRPFAPIVALFGGKPTHDWMLPDAYATPFHSLYFRDERSADPKAQLVAALQRLEQLKARRAQLRQSAQMNQMATDLDALGNHLLFTADNMNSVATLSEQPRREAVELAKEILRKLKISIGNLNILEGLKLKPKGDLAALGAVKGAALVYERLLAWARGIDATILQRPEILAATQAIGQLGYLAKLEAMRAAQAAGNSVVAGKIAAQLKLIPPHFAQTSELKFAGLLDRVERGIDTVLNRIQEINGPGAMVGHSPAKELGSYMSGAPIAGQSLQLSADGARTRNDRNAAILEAQDLAERAQAQRIQAQSAARTQQQGNTARAPASRTASGRQALQQARAQQQRAATNAAIGNPAINQPGVLNAAQRAALAQRAAMLHSHEEEEDHKHLDQSVMMQFQRAMSLANTNGKPVEVGRASLNAALRGNSQKQQSTAAQNANNQQFVKAETNIHNNEIAQEAAIRNAPPPPPNKGGRGLA